MGLADDAGCADRGVPAARHEPAPAARRRQIYALQNLDGSYVSGGPIDTRLSHRLPAVRRSRRCTRRCAASPIRTPSPSRGSARCAWPASPLAMVTGPILVTLGPEGDGNLVVVAVGTAILSLLVLMRLAGLVGLAGARRCRAARPRGAADLSGLPRPADRAGQPAPLRRRHDGGPRHADERRVPSRSCSSTSTTSRPSTTASATRPATGSLRAVAERIRASVRATDVAARLGGDEFGVLLTDVPDVVVRRRRGDARCSTSLDAPIEVAGEHVTAGASIGIALDTAETAGVDDLLGQRGHRDVPRQGAGQGPSPRVQPRGRPRQRGRRRPGRIDGTVARRAAASRSASPPSGRPALGPEPG